LSVRLVDCSFLLQSHFTRVFTTVCTSTIAAKLRRCRNNAWSLAAVRAQCAGDGPEDNDRTIDLSGHANHSEARQ
jgi:hypothetical protein